MPHAYTQCIRPYPDKLSDEIRRSGHWSDCDALVELWRSTTRRGRSTDLFVDAGANIGSCSLLMLAEGARTVAFEPLPANLFYLTSAVLSNPRAFRRRLTLYPIGLGEAAAAATPIFSSPSNAGNSVLRRAIGDDDADERAMQGRAGAQQASVHVDTLDAVLWPDASAPPPRVALMKLDVQGFEVQLLRGARRLLNASAVRTIKFEVATRWLHAQGTTAAALCALLDSHGFRMTERTREAQTKPSTCDRFAQLDGQPSAIVDFVAQQPPEALGAPEAERERRRRQGHQGTGRVRGRGRRRQRRRRGTQMGTHG